LIAALLPPGLVQVGKETTHASSPVTFRSADPITKIRSNLFHSRDQLLGYGGTLSMD
jgi:hypothetical protein